MSLHEDEAERRSAAEEQEGTFEVRTEYLGDEPEDNAGWVATVYAKVGYAEGATEKEAADAAWQAAQSAPREQDVEILRSALERLRDNARNIFKNTPVRDWGETLAEADAALKRTTPKKEGLK